MLGAYYRTLAGHTKQHSTDTMAPSVEILKTLCLVQESSHKKDTSIIYIECPEEARTQRQTVQWWLPGAGGRGRIVDVHGNGVS